MMKSKAKALYIHIPFCKSICTYCDFKKFIYHQKRVDEYFKSLFLQLETLKNNKYRSIYIGGGTPSCIDKYNLETLLIKCNELLDEKYIEFSIENNVEDINDEYLSLLNKYKINRLSIGVQSFNEKYIKYCGRHHTQKMAIDNINKASKYIKNISIDLIFAFNNQTIKEISQDIEIATSLPIKHLSYYSLLIEENTILYNQQVNNVDESIQSKMYKFIYNKLKKKGFNRYEISNFAKNKKYQSYHNLTYWRNMHYDAIGLASSGYIDNIRFTNTININRYINNDFTLSEEVTLSKEDIMFDEIMMRLRLDEGLNINKFNKKFKVDFFLLYEDALKFNIDNKLLVCKSGILKTTFKGSLLLNSVLESFLID